MSKQVYLKPVAIYKDPFQQEHHKLVLCETYKFNKEPATTNYRMSCLEVRLEIKFSVYL
jgi:glutamine synthetase